MKPVLIVYGLNHETGNIGSKVCNVLKRKYDIIDMYSESSKDISVESSKDVSMISFVGKAILARAFSTNPSDTQAQLYSNLELPILHTVSLMRTYPHKLKRIILMGSMAYKKALTGHSIYAAAKAGLVAFARTVAYEEASRGGKTKIWVIAPGSVENTPMLSKMVFQSAVMKGTNQPTIKEQIKASFPDGKMVQISSLIHLIEFLLSGNADQMSGHCFEIDNCQR